MIGIAAGLALAGKIPYVSTYSALVPGRCLDQIRNAVAYPNLDVKIVSSHGGVSVGPDGASHQTVEDVAAMRAIPHLRVVVPADAPSTRVLIEESWKTPGPFYIRLTRPSVPEIYSSRPALKVGRVKVLKEGTDLAIIACGVMVNEALEAGESLAKEKISAEIIDSHTLKPLDADTIPSIKTFVDMGVLDGITTNPTLIAKESREFVELVTDILRLVQGPVNLEVVSQESEGMVREGHDLAALGPNVVVKCPMTGEGLKAVRRLHKDGIKTNVTLVFSPNQALLAAKAGADYVSPFIGRLDDAGHEGMKIIEEILQIYRNYNIDTQVLVASIRHPVHVVQAAKLGAHVATMPADVLDKMVKHPLTDIGLKRFLDDWQKAGLRLPEGRSTVPKAKPLVQRA